MSVVDCRQKSVPEAGAAIIARYSAAAPGERFDALVSDLAPGLKMWLLEAGVRHTARSQGDAWRLSIERRASPAQGSIPGLHHLAAQGDSIWACTRAQRVGRFASDGQCIVARAVARKASHLTLHEQTRRLFVADAEGCEIVALRADDLSETARWPAPGSPQLPLVSDEGIVCVTGGGTGTVTIGWPDGNGYRAKSIPVGAAPHDPCLDDSGAHVFVPCAGESAIVKLRLADGAVVGRIAVGDGPSHLAIHGDRVYSANSWDGSVSCISVSGAHISQATSGGWAHAIDLSPDGRFVYVGNFFDDTVAVFDAATLERLALLRTEPYAHGLDVSPDGRHLVTTGFCSGAVRVFDATTFAELARVDVGQGSSHTVFTPDGAWVACSVSDQLAKVDIAAGKCIGRAVLPPA